MRNLTRRANCCRWYIFDLNHYETTVCYHRFGTSITIEATTTSTVYTRLAGNPQCPFLHEDFGTVPQNWTNVRLPCLSLLSLFGTVPQNGCAISLNLLSLFPLLTPSLRTGPTYVFPVCLSLSPFPSLAPSFRTGVPFLSISFLSFPF